MSNFLAVATVTATLNELLLSALVRDVPGGLSNATVTNHVPSQSNTGSAPRVNVYMFRSEINATLRDEDLPTRRASGDPIQRPRLALDLEYLLSFYGDTQTLVPQRLFGIVNQTLNGRPILSRESIGRTIEMPRYSYLATSDLAYQTEMIKFSPMRSSIEEMSRIWHMFAQAEYRLSYAVQASVVLIDSPITTRPALPVRTPRVYVLPFQEPMVETVAPLDGEDVEADSVLLVQGSNLDGANVSVEFGEQTFVPTDLKPESLRVSLTPLTTGASGIAAGPSMLRVVTHLRSATGPRFSTSSGYSLSVRPKITGIRVGTASPRTVEVDLVPALGPGQQVVLLLNDTDGARATLTREPELDVIETVEFEVPDTVVAGTYLVRVEVQGVQSVLEWAAGVYTGPTATLPAALDD